jgi:hypothetical protein
MKSKILIEGTSKTTIYKGDLILVIVSTDSGIHHHLDTANKENTRIRKRIFKGGGNSQSIILSVTKVHFISQEAIKKIKDGSI